MQPFWLDAAKQTMLARVQPGGDGLLLDSKRRTVASTDAERTALLRAGTCLTRNARAQPAKGSRIET